MGFQISTAGDVYSYGVILLEMVTGKRPTDDMFKDGLSLRNFVQSAFPQRVGEISDSSLIPIPYHDITDARHGSENGDQILLGIQNSIKQLAELGLKCYVDSPRDRPGIQHIYDEIMTIRGTFSALNC